MNVFDSPKAVEGIEKEGFTKSYWKKYRARSCKNSGVSKNLKILKAKGVQKDGLPSDGVDEDTLIEIITVYDDLNTAFGKAKKKAESNDDNLSVNFCKKYEQEMVKIINKANNHLKSLQTGKTPPKWR